MAVFLSEKSVQSMWARREWQSFLSRQIKGETITVLPILIEECRVPEIIADINYADFSESYHEGFLQLYNALK
jgi:hypothetical protein